MNLSNSFLSAISFLTLLLLLPLALTSQIWDEVYNASEAHAIHYADDGSFLLVGGTGDPSESYFDMSVKKIDRAGNLIWEQLYIDTEGTSTMAREIVALDNGDFLVLSNTYPTDNQFIRLLHINKSGIILAEANLDEYGIEGLIYSAIMTQDGNIVFTLNLKNVSNSTYAYSLIKIDPSGELLWTEEIAEGNHYPNAGLLETEDGKIYAASNDGIVVFSAAGERINTIAMDTRVHDLHVLPSGDLLVVGNTLPTLNGINHISRISDTGDLMWEISTGPDIGHSNLDFIEPLANGNYFAIGGLFLGTGPDAGELSSGVSAFEFSSEGDLIWYETFLGTALQFIPTDIYSIDQTSFVISNLRNYYGDTEYITSAATMFTAGVSEKRFLWKVNTLEDENENCLDDAEPALASIPVRIQGNNEIHFMNTDENGATEFQLLAGEYTSRVVINEELWLNTDCILPQTDSLNELNSLVEHDFLLHERIFCPSLSASSTISVLRPCFSNNPFSVRICNNGTVIADTAIVVVFLPAGVTTYVQNDLHPQGEWLNNFQIPWYDLAPGECASANFELFLECSVGFGSTLCVTTQLLISQVCDGNPVPQAFDQFCRTTTGSYDPNNKLANPIGTGEENIIAPDTPLKYTINFQNTGTDTAFLVVIRDTLPTELNSASIRPGVSSHPYQLTIEKDSILIFTFPQILLPDSNVNVIGSQGYVRYDIEMQPGLPLGTTINNRAGIYFDFNDPILTEYAFHKLGIPTDVMEITDEISVPFKLYPNPAQAQVSLIYQDESAFSNLRYQIITMDGRIIYSGSSSGKAPINIEALLPGIYLVLAWSEKDYLGAQTMVKQ